MQRFSIRRTNLLKPLLWRFGAFSGNSYVELDPDMLRARFGPLFDRRISLSDVESVSVSHWPFLFGLGWRTDFSGRIALVGSYKRISTIPL